MKYILIAIMSLEFFACNTTVQNQILQNRIDSLEKKLTNTYESGFGEFMMGIQAHHSKLWFAGQNQNWKLAEFEIHEIKEGIADIQKFHTERKESQTIGMLNPAIDTVNNAIQQQNPLLFKNSFVLLTNTCNNCHQAVKYEFNIIKIPDISPFSNQEFRVNEQK